MHWSGKKNGSAFPLLITSEAVDALTFYTGVETVYKEATDNICPQQNRQLTASEYDKHYKDEDILGDSKTGIVSFIWLS
jgi:hypothetical protein